VSTGCAGDEAEQCFRCVARLRQLALKPGPRYSIALKITADKVHVAPAQGAYGSPPGIAAEAPKSRCDEYFSGAARCQLLERIGVPKQAGHTA
jgi:hypothetical protein